MTRESSLEAALREITEIAGSDHDGGITEEIEQIAKAALSLPAEEASGQSEGKFTQSANVSVPRALVERAMESCQVNNDHYAWKELLRCLDPAGAPK